jgi:peptidoglycan/LPS O-acetylase OafA/YrhL
VIRIFDFDLKILSNQRTQIMGFAMLCVVFFHSSFDLSFSPPLKILKQWGDIGVDIFLVMSGMGIYHSLNRRSDIPAYIRGRLRRIVPEHLLVCGVWFFFLDVLLYSEGVSAFLMDVTSLNFWINGRLTNWYLSSLLLMQLLTPAFINHWKKHSAAGLLAVPVVLLICLVITYTPVLDENLGHLLVFFYRIPAYLIGLFVGRRICENRSVISIPVPLVLIALSVSAGILFISSGLTPLYLRWSLRYAAYLPISLTICCIVTRLPDNKVFHHFGTNSLEIYLLHEKVLWVLSILAYKVIGDGLIQSTFVNILAILLTCIGAKILKYIFTHIITEKGVKSVA